MKNRHVPHAVGLFLLGGILLAPASPADADAPGRVIDVGPQATGSSAALPGKDAPGSIGLWFARKPGAADQVFFVYGKPEVGRGRGVWLVREDELCFYFWGRPDDLHVKVPGGVTAGAWHQIVCTYDGSAARLFYDGKLLGSVETKIDTDPAGRYFLRRNFVDDGRDFDGLLEDVKVYGRALSADEIQRAYTEGIDARKPVHFPSLAGRCEAKEIVFAVRQSDTDGHWYANFGDNIINADRKYYHDGGRLCMLDVESREVRTLVDDASGGVRDPQMHYDGRKILFSYRKGGQPYYHLFEINVDGTGLRQLTSGAFDDIEPAYLPSGGIVFCSSRCRRWVPCYFTQVAVLYRCDGDGQNIRRLSANTEHENTPWVLPDGRILYQRWEYVDRSQIGYHHLWTMNPDGTGQMIYFGNLHPDTVMIDAKPIPGTRRIVASFAPGHGRNEHMGTVTVVDPGRGPDAREMARPVTRGGFFRDPYPLAEDLFLAAREGSILLLDRSGNSETLFDLPAEWRVGRMQVHEPRPVRARPRERVIPSRIDASSPTGTVVLEDIYRGRNMEGVEPGEIKKLLVLEILPKPYNMFSGMEPLTYGGTFLLQRILGTVPVEPDGSAHVELPAMRPVFFVALDGNGMAVKRMQSFLTVQPGERVGCVGCHEQRTETPRSSKPPAALRRPADAVAPIAGVPDVIDFPRDVQPILDAHCVACHDYAPTDRGGPMAGGIVLAGDRGPMFSHSYYMLTVSGQFSNGRNMRKSNYAPRTLGSSASPMLDKLDGGHYDVKLSDGEKTAVRLWIECGAVYAGTYASLGTGSLGHYASGPIDRPDLEWPSTRDAREVLARRCAGCHQGGLALPDSPTDNRRLVPWAEGPMNDLARATSQRNHPAFRFNRHSLYNLSRPEKSLQLLAPLSKAAGGFGTCESKAGAAPDLFATADDPDYQKLLAAIDDAKKYLDRIKRFDMPGFRPRAEYIGQMQRFGILPEQIPSAEPIDPYETDRAYWQSSWKEALQNAGRE